MRIARSILLLLEHNTSRVATGIVVVCVPVLLGVNTFPGGAYQVLATRAERSCQIAGGAARPLMLRDGAVVVSDASAIATDGRFVLIAGVPTHAWRAPTIRGSAKTSAVKAVGLLRHPLGYVELVASPLPHLALAYPRVAWMPDGWHFLFIVGEPGTLAFETAEVWHGVYKDGRWKRVRRIALASSASLLPGMSSDLIVSKQGVAFAYSYDRAAILKSNAPGNQGIVLLHQRSGEWSADTLRTWEGPRAVQLTLSGDGAMIAVYAQSWFAQSRPQASTLFTARYDTVWNAPVRGPNLDQGTYVTAPLVSAHGSASSAISWRLARYEALPDVLQWGHRSDSGTVRYSGTISEVAPGDRSVVLALDSVRTLWLLRDGASRTHMRAYLGSGAALHDLGVVTLPYDNPAPIAAILEGGKIVIVTGSMGKSSAEPPASSYLTVASVRCKTAMRIAP